MARTTTNIHTKIHTLPKRTTTTENLGTRKPIHGKLRIHLSTIHPDITQQDLKWSQEVAEDELEDIIEANRELNPIPDSIDFKNQNPDQTGPPPSL
ncbi:hypothetical protein ACSBR2_019522 [Camellia fascicularis]